MESRASAQHPEYDINPLLIGSDQCRQAALGLLRRKILDARLQTSVLGRIIELPSPQTIYSSIINDLNDKRFSVDDRKTKQIRADIRSCLSLALAEKAARVISENNLVHLKAELAGLKAIASEIELLKGAGGFAKFNAKKGAMKEIEGFIGDIEKAIRAFPSEAKLIEAASAGDLDEVKRCLNQGVNINYQDQTGRTALFWAARHGHQSVVNYLLGEGANFNILERNYGVSPLDAAASHGHLEAVQALLGANADVNQTRKDGTTTALYMAAQEGHDKVVQALIGANADVNKTGENSATALLIAAQQGHDEVIQALIGANADINKTREDGATAVGFAAQKGHLAIVEFLVTQGAILNYLTTKKYSPLIVAIDNNKLPVATFLLKTMIHNAKISVDESGNVISLPENKTIYSFIIDALNDKRLVKKYLENDNLRKNIRACLSEALTEKVKLVIEEGQLAPLQAELAGLEAIQSQVRLLQGTGGTGLRDREKQAMIEVRGLIEKIASAIKVTTPETALLKAAKSNNLNEVIRLIKADPRIINSQDEAGRAALFWAAGNGHHSVVNYLLGEGANFNILERDYGQSPLDTAAFNGYVGIVQALLKANADVNQTRKNGVTALYVAAQQGHDNVARVLIEAKADVNKAMEDGATPLYTAAKNGHTAIVDFLANENAFFNQVRAWCGEYKTPLGAASDAGHDEIVSKLRAIQDKRIRSFFPELDIKKWEAANYAGLVEYINSEEPNYQHNFYLRKMLRLLLIVPMNERVNFLLCHGATEHLNMEVQALEKLKTELKIIQKTDYLHKHAMNEIEGFIVALKEKIANPAVTLDIKLPNAKKTFHFGGFTLFDKEPSVQVDTNVQSISTLTTPTKKRLVELDPSADTMRGFHNQL